MGKIPSRNTVTADGLLNNMQHASSSVKAYFTDFAAVIEQKSVSATNFGKITGDLAVLKRALVSLAEHPDTDAVAQARFGRPITDDALAMVAKLDAARDAIHELIPANKAGFLEICWWDTDGTFAWKAFTPADLEPLKLIVDEIIDSID